MAERNGQPSADEFASIGALLMRVADEGRRFDESMASMVSFGADGVISVHELDAAGPVEPPPDVQINPRWAHIIAETALLPGMTLAVLKTRCSVNPAEVPIGDILVFWNTVLTVKPEWIDVVSVIDSLGTFVARAALLFEWKDKITPTRDQLIRLVPLLHVPERFIAHFLQKQPLSTWPSEEDLEYVSKLCRNAIDWKCKVTLVETVVGRCTPPVDINKTFNLGAKLMNTIAAIAYDRQAVSDRARLLSAFMANWPLLQDLPMPPPPPPDGYCLVRDLVEMHNIDVMMQRERQRLAVNISLAALPADAKTEDRQKQCTICNDNAKRVVMVPCGHHYSCVACHQRVTDNKCAYCRATVKSVVPFHPIEA